MENWRPAWAPGCLPPTRPPRRPSSETRSHCSVGVGASPLADGPARRRATAGRTRRDAALQSEAVQAVLSAGRASKKSTAKFSSKPLESSRFHPETNQNEAAPPGDCALLLAAVSLRCAATRVRPLLPAASARWDPGAAAPPSAVGQEPANPSWSRRRSPTRPLAGPVSSSRVPLLP